jgi:hypothetical protein
LIYCSCIGNQSALNRSLRTSRLLSVATGVLVCLAAGQSEPGRAAAATTPLAFAFTTASPPPPSDLPEFRLGTAAAGLGWSTVVADFNTDGTPDVAIADRVAHPLGAPSFTIEFAVSGLQSKTVAFESDQDALTVRVSDVDHDNDLDLVVSAAFSHEVVAVWLNDGSGDFEPSTAFSFAAEIEPRHTVDAPGPSCAVSSNGLAPRSTAGMPCAGRWTMAVLRRSNITVQPKRLQPALLSSALSSRAPPLSVPKSFS